MPYNDGKNNLKHTVWYFQSVASCYAMRNLLQDNPSWKSYKVVLCAGPAAGIGEAAKDFVDKALKSKGMTITLSCGKLLTGVTIPEWSGIFMLNDKKTPEAYFQSAFRVQSPWYCRPSDGSLPDDEAILKKVCYVFDFSPMRALEQVRQYAEGLIGGANGNDSAGDIEEAIRNFIRFLPIISCDDSGMRQMDPNDILAKIYCGESSPSFVRKVRHISVDLSPKFVEELNKNKALYEALKMINPDDLPDDPSDIIVNPENGLQKGSGEKEAKDNKSKDSKKERKTNLDKLRDRIKILCSRIPLFMYLTDKREKDINECLNKKNSPQLFKNVVGLDQNLFEQILMTLDKSDLIRIIISFKQLEESSYNCYGFNLREEAEQMELLEK